MKNKKEFEAQWANCVNDPDFKPYRDEYGTKHQVIWAIDFVVYNILRNMPLDRGFTNADTSYSFSLALRHIKAYLKISPESMLGKFGDTVDVDKFRERAYEALRLHNNS